MVWPARLLNRDLGVLYLPLRGHPVYNGGDAHSLFSSHGLYFSFLYLGVPSLKVSPVGVFLTAVILLNPSQPYCLPKNILKYCYLVPIQIKKVYTTINQV